MKTYGIYLFILSIIIISCEKEIEVNVPISEEQLVVEASINQYSPILNYVFLTTSVDYFKPDLSLGGVDGAITTVTEGRISGADTIYDGIQTRFYNLYDIPGADTLFEPIEGITSNLRGVYLNPFFTGKENTPYRLDITLEDGRRIEATTFIPSVIPIDTVKYEFRGTDQDGDKAAFVSFFWNEPPPQNNYRLFIKKQNTPVLLGWGAADFSRTFDDEFLGNQYRAYSFFRPFKENDTINLYLTHVGRKEFIFWQSYEQANNFGNPFATPVILKSNIKGAIGTFTGYAVTYRQVIIQ